MAYDGLGNYFYEELPWQSGGQMPPAQPFPPAPAPPVASKPDPLQQFYGNPVAGDPFYGMKGPVVATAGAMGKGLADMISSAVTLPFDWGKYYEPVQPETPGQLSEIDLAREQLQKQELTKRTGDVAAMLTGGVSSLAKIPVEAGEVALTAGRARRVPARGARPVAEDVPPPPIGHNQPPPEYSYSQWAKDLPKPQPAAQGVDVPSIRGMPVDQAIDLARTQPHLIKSGEKAEGAYIGGPRDIESKADLTKRRKYFDQYAARDPRGGDWYDRYRAALGETTGNIPSENAWQSAMHGQWSAGVSPDSELNFVLKELNSAIAGTPQTAFYENQHQAHLNAIRNRDPSLYRLHDKTEEYARQVNPDQPLPPGATGVNDFRNMRNWGYTNPGGAPWKNKPTGPQGTFVDMETALAVDRANRANLGGRSDWTGEQLQAAPWVRQKALDLMSRNKALAYEEAFQRANRQIGDFYDKHTAFATYEFQPGSSTGHMLGSIAASPAERAAYAQDSSWATAPGNRDALYAGMGFEGGPHMRVRPTLSMQGVYLTPEGKIETNPGGVGRPLVSFNTGETRAAPFKETTAHDQAILNAVEAVRGVVDAQNASAWHKLWFGGPSKQSTSLFFPREPGAGTPSPESLVRLRDDLAKYDITDVVDTGQGVTATKFYEGPPAGGKEFDRAMRKGELSDLGFGAPRRARIGEGDKGYIDRTEQWQQGVGSQAVTKQMLEYVNTTPEIRAALNNNPYLADVALARMSRDEAWTAKWGAPREDLTNLRQIMAGGKGWVDRVEAALKAGAILPATVAAVYSAGLMAQQEGSGADAGL